MPTPEEEEEEEGRPVVEEDKAWIIENVLEDVLGEVAEVGVEVGRNIRLAWGSSMKSIV